ncbi:hypothetical protein QR77_15210 [Streptomyces sp. 150FB]|uniref:hypothetical protein n=1 Tax=Streptomyces sp. 150FB TaxID=1576605 RepID=UPI0005894DF1|nr:hypothetical protein [Streptomyces sp. 150FB]KIF74939.1 hypothetical protein QR77_15210 [Streptomyces sp. 150FB]
MAWEEWEQLKSEAARRSSAKMGLDHVAPEPGGGGGPGTLNHTDGPWTHAAAVAGTLRTGLNTAKRDLDIAVGKAPTGVEGLTSLSALTEVHTSWDERLTAVGRECGSLGPKLTDVAAIMGEVDTDTGAQSDAVHVPSAWKEGQ